LPTQSAQPQTYAERFRCTGSACEDTCCKGWTVPLDQATFDRYQALPPSPLKVLVEQSVERVLPGPGSLSGTAGGKPIYGRIRMNAANECPLLTADQLCSVQKELGEAMLSPTCATYPRIVHSLAGVGEMALTLSCPEAARLVLLTPDLTGTWPAGTWPAPVAQPGADGLAEPLPPDFWAIRATALRIVQARTYPLWQRMFLLYILCSRLDMIARGELTRPVAEFLIEFEAAMATGELRYAMDELPIDRNAQLDVVLRLAGMLLHKSNVRPRFVEAIKNFTAGVGNGPGATLDTLSMRYAQANDHYFAPFTRRHPHMLKNFVINTIVRCQFPFGREGMKAGAPSKKAYEFELLAAQFVLMRGLLIGVAGFHGATFSEAHVIETVQPATKHFEHHPEFLTLAHSLLVEREMNNARGLSMLLRDFGLANPRVKSAAAQVASPHPGVAESTSATAVKASQALPGERPA
jgi:lysine-N-methylase